MRTGGFPELVCGASHDGGTVVTLDYESSRGETENRSGDRSASWARIQGIPSPLGGREDVNVQQDRAEILEKWAKHESGESPLSDEEIKNLCVRKLMLDEA